MNDIHFFQSLNDSTAQNFLFQRVMWSQFFLAAFQRLGHFLFLKLLKTQHKSTKVYSTIEICLLLKILKVYCTQQCHLQNETKANILEQVIICLLRFVSSLLSCESYVPKLYTYFQLQENYWRYFKIIACTKLKCIDKQLCKKSLVYFYNFSYNDHVKK